MNPNCPRCGTQALVPLCGGGVECLACDYKEIKDDMETLAEAMAAVPGMPPPTRAERHDAPKDGRRTAMKRRWEEIWVKDEELAGEIAQRYGVSLESLQGNFLLWRSISSSTRRALHDTIAGLTAAGLGIHRIARALDKSCRAIEKSPGLARGRAARKHDRSPTLP